MLLLSISINTHAGERLEGISGSVGKSANPFAKLLGNNTKDENISTSDKQQPEGITSDIMLKAEQEKKSADTPAEINLIADINAEFEDTINKLAVEEIKPTLKSVQKKPTQLFNKDSEVLHSSSKNNRLHTVNEISATQSSGEDCVKEKVYSLDVDNAAQYERLEDFPFTYECVIRR